MNMQEKTLPYRGDIRAIAATGNTLAWVTQHPQAVATAVYRLDIESMEMVLSTELGNAARARNARRLSASAA